MRNFVATKNVGENIHSPPMLEEILSRCNADIVRFHEAIALLIVTMTNEYWHPYSIG